MRYLTYISNHPKHTMPQKLRISHRRLVCNIRAEFCMYNLALSCKNLELRDDKFS